MFTVGKVAGKRFTPEQQAYLRGLPAVREVSETRIRYSKAFRRHCVERYRAGASPTELFREAGLAPTLIGAKRIERCIARWKNSPLDAEGDDASGVKAAGASVAVPAVASSASVASASPAVSAASSSSVAEPVAAQERVSAWHISSESGMMPELVISQQSHYIAVLEQRVATLERELAASKARHRKKAGA
ncbi:hypothetical protein GFD17_01655 [Bifidobacterium sp. SMB2]|uniref:Transposase n=1 Tax=Bifidobacterium saimiriisciurei TaxID=2661627 RepID=A0ABX0C913_9BIFI|nr:MULTISPECIES: HTH domain-containing protein [Bifidobacterium]NEG95478.1 hypothetical protein [Bifidobacterium sp. SMB2]NEH11636.1 hypothetical protein [Bifidobacterium saimiriisciurei]